MAQIGVFWVGRMKERKGVEEEGKEIMEQIYNPLDL